MVRLAATHCLGYIKPGFIRKTRELISYPKIRNQFIRLPRGVSSHLLSASSNRHGFNKFNKNSRCRGKFKKYSEVLIQINLYSNEAILTKAQIGATVPLRICSF
jgi:hypothetical protein